MLSIEVVTLGFNATQEKGKKSTISENITITGLANVLMTQSMRSRNLS